MRQITAKFVSRLLSDGQKKNCVPGPARSNQK